MTRHLSKLDCDVLVVGRGVAGLSAARAAREQGCEVVVVGTGEGSTALAQGGIAAALLPEDSPRQHALDTLAVGEGLADPKAVAVLVESAPSAVRDLEALGVPFDRTATGELALGREGGHSRRRIVSSLGAATGRAVQGVLRRATDALGIPHVEASLAGLATASGRVVGALFLSCDGSSFAVAARATVLATGGFAGLFASHTSPGEADGRGILAAYLVGADLRDLEFVQFHPTVLAAGRGDEPPLLLSEALRGEGARLIDEKGRPLVQDHPMGELAPRHVVARAVFRRIRDGGQAFLDLRPLGAKGLSRFPSLVAAVRARGFEPSQEPLPVTAAAHYTVGGIGTGLSGETEVPGLFAAGEAASTGVHGASRLASNSLLEGLVFGRRAGLAAAQFAALAPPPPDASRWYLELLPEPSTWSLPLEVALGIERDAASLSRLLADESAPLLARLAACAALLRTETRGAHVRVECPHPDPSLAGHFVFRRGKEGESAQKASPVPASFPLPAFEPVPLAVPSDAARARRNPPERSQEVPDVPRRTSP